MTLDDRWFTEPCEECGTAFSMRIRAKLHEEQSSYQKIEIYDTDTFGHLMVIDGFVMLSQRDNFVYHEMMAHPALFTHRHPRRVVIVGGGDCGTLREVLRHPQVESVVQVEIDERVTRVAERYFPELCESNDDKRAEFFFGDGIQWFKDAPAESLDVVIIDSTDPIGPAEGLFSADFYRSCHASLRPGGVLVQQSESPLLHTRLIQRMHRDMRSAGFSDTALLQFFQPTYPSGWWSATLAGKDQGLHDIRVGDIDARPFHSRYYNLAMHRAALALPPFMQEALAPAD